MKTKERQYAIGPNGKVPINDSLPHPDAASRNPAGMTGPSGPQKPQEGFVGPKPTLATIARDKGVMAKKLATVATEKRKKADELGLIAKQKRQIANDLAAKVPKPRNVGGITGIGGKSVNSVYNTY